MKKTIKFQPLLLNWYDKHRRDLPWRRTQEAYKIWISEIMLQQTQVKTVIPYYERFLTRFPTVDALARAEEEDVLAHWAGLGYYRRAKLLHRGAQKVVHDFGGRLPQTPAELKTLPGIGDYTAGAIASIAFDQAAPLVDGNVIRVYSRLFAIHGHAKDTKLQKEIWKIAAQHLSQKRPGDFNQALMELGATLCRVRLPSCERCPVQKFCLAYANGEPESFPETPPQTKTVSLYRAAAVCQKNGEILLVKKKQPRWFQGMWELPHEYFEPSERPQEILADYLKSDFGLNMEPSTELPTTRHGITHHRIITQAWQTKVSGRQKLAKHYETAEFFPKNQLQTMALASFDRKVLQAGGIF